MSSVERSGRSVPASIRGANVDCTSSCGLTFHTLTSGKHGQPLVLFCHGFPELAFSWRKVMPQIAEAGYYCVAMDQRGYGRTTGWNQDTYDAADLRQYTMTNLVRDLICLVYKLGYQTVRCIVGHDFGAVVSSSAALIRPDMFQSTIHMSHPYHAPPTPQCGTQVAPAKVDIQAALAELDPPRQHYKWYNSSPQAAHDYEQLDSELDHFLRGYFHIKSADWERNEPHPLSEWSAEALGVMPRYYVMNKGETMPHAVETCMRGEDFSRTTSWLPEEDLQVYADTWRHTGMQAALNWYRAQTSSDPRVKNDMLLFAGRRIEVPCTFISGSKDWGNYQQPGALEGYENDNVVKRGCFKGAVFVDGAGHWVQQEQPKVVIEHVLAFLGTIAAVS